MTERRSRDLRIILAAALGTSLAVALPAAAGTVATTRDDGDDGPTAAARPSKSIDADTLDGLDSTAFARSASQPFAATGTGAAGTLPAVGRTQAATVVITAPTDGMVLLTAEASFDARETREQGEVVHAFLTESNVDKATAVWGPGDVDGAYDQHQTMTAAVPVSSGLHTFTLELQDWWTVGAYRDPVPSGYVNPKITATYLPGRG